MHSYDFDLVSSPAEIIQQLIRIRSTQCLKATGELERIVQTRWFPLQNPKP